MHSVGIHSALAIKRQRKRRDDQRKSKEHRRYSTQSSESGDHSPHGSTRRKGRYGNFSKESTDMLDSKVVTSIGMLHIGVVFVVFGLFLIGAGFLPDDFSSWSFLTNPATYWNELICTGLFALGLGIFLIVLNGFISKREEDDLEDYVQRQLTRSRSGHRLERDVETGVLTTRNHRRAKAAKDLADISQSNITPSSSEILTPTTPLGLESTGDMLLEKILEEDSSYGDEYTRTQALSPMGNDKKYLLGNGHSGSVNITNI